MMLVLTGIVEDHENRRRSSFGSVGSSQVSSSVRGNGALGEDASDLLVTTFPDIGPVISRWFVANNGQAAYYPGPAGSPMRQHGAEVDHAHHLQLAVRETCEHEDFEQLGRRIKVLHQESRRLSENHGAPSGWQGHQSSAHGIRQTGRFARGCLGRGTVENNVPEDGTYSDEEDAWGYDPSNERQGYEAQGVTQTTVPLL